MDKWPGPWFWIPAEENHASLVNMTVLLLLFWFMGSSLDQLLLGLYKGWDTPEVSPLIYLILC